MTESTSSHSFEIYDHVACYDAKRGRVTGWIISVENKHVVSVLIDGKYKYYEDEEISYNIKQCRKLKKKESK